MTRWRDTVMARRASWVGFGVEDGGRGMGGHRHPSGSEIGMASRCRHDVILMSALAPKLGRESRDMSRGV